MENQLDIEYNNYFELTADIYNDLVINPWELSFNRIYIVKEDFYTPSFYKSVLEKNDNFEENKIKQYSKSIIKRKFTPKFTGSANYILSSCNCFDYYYLKQKEISNMSYFELCLMRYILALNDNNDFLFIELELDRLNLEERAELLGLIFKNKGKKTVFLNENSDELIYKYADFIIDIENKETKLYSLKEYIYKSIF